MTQTIQQLIISVRLLRDEYDRALLINQQLIEQRHQIANEIHRWAHDPKAVPDSLRLGIGGEKGGKSHR